MENPILDEVRELIEAHPSGVSEYDLLVSLQAHEALQFKDIDSGLRLFRKHFLVMNALYHIQELLLQEGRYLSISPIVNRLETSKEMDALSLPIQSAQARVRDYYYDWDNYQKTAVADVDKLLTGFWQRYLSDDKRWEALQTLGLPVESEMSEVKRRYRKLVHEYHPDRGGNVERFREIREAYEVLMCSSLNS